METQERFQSVITRLTPGTTIYGIVRHVSASGQSRVIDFLVLDANHPYWISGLMEDTLGLKRHRRYDGLVVHGCGMNMVFACVYALGRALFPQGCQMPPGYSRNGECQAWEPDGGYAFRAETL